jgi:hypothetical protein
MKTLTRDEALTELADLPGYDELVAKNVLFEATKNPYIVTNDGALFIAHTHDSRFLFADVKRNGYVEDGAAFAAMLNEASAAGARFPGWPDDGKCYCMGGVGPHEYHGTPRA